MNDTQKNARIVTFKDLRRLAEAYTRYIMRKNGAIYGGTYSRTQVETYGGINGGIYGETHKKIHGE